jgi:hypothetical protein
MTSSAVSWHRVVEPVPFTPAEPMPPATAAAPMGGIAPRAGRVAGRYRYDRRTGGWWWSAEMFALHGLAPGTQQPDTETCLRYQRTEDRARVLDAISGACTSGRDFALETRIVRADGSQRDLVLVGEAQVDATGTVTAVEGMAVDITECHAPGSPTERAQSLQVEVEQLRAAMASRASIEQAKGILMLLTSCTDQVAFDLLAHISSHTHRKVREVALVITQSAAGRTRLPDDVRAIIRDACPPSQPLR